MNRNKKDVQPFWRPNFVNQAELPDIKVIRTDFIINFVAVVLFLLVGFYLVQREYRAYSLSKTISNMQQQIRVAESDNSIHLRMSEEFRKSAAHVAELEKFYASPVVAHEFLAELARMCPEDLIFSQVSLIEQMQKEGTTTSVMYRINIGGDVRSLTVLDEFKGELAEWELLNSESYLLEIDEALQGRDAETGIFPYTLEITLEPVSEAAPNAEGENT